MDIREQIEAYKSLLANRQAFFIDNVTDSERIIEALERDIPMRPVINTNHKYTEAWSSAAYLCANCKGYAGNKSGRYCTYCGQAIDWSKEITDEL